MNRLVIIGNGFDLAHGLNTSYNHFLEKIWYDEYFNLYRCPWSGYNGKFFNTNNVPPMHPLTEKEGNFKKLKDLFKNNNIDMVFSNKLFAHISEILSEKNWADIENIFYDILIGLLPSDKTKRIPAFRYKSIDKLNEDFEQIKIMLIQYLQEISEDNVLSHAEIFAHINENFKIIDFGEKFKKKYTEELYSKIRILISAVKNDPEKYKSLSTNERIVYERFHVDYSANAIINYLLSPLDKNLEYFDLNPKKIMLLNFNYTSTPENYIQEHLGIKNVTVNYIHGCLKNIDTNPIIFGFGDELDENYHLLEDEYDNKFLENIKSISYLRTYNYKWLLEFIESDPFQVSIMGHSCGLSDRTMLNSIFEHQNCQSVKVYYHLREDGSDNYNDITRNISRHFRNKARMRDRVVNKTLCGPLTNSRSV